MCRVVQLQNLVLQHADILVPFDSSHSSDSNGTIKSTCCSTKFWTCALSYFDRLFTPILTWEETVDVEGI